MSLLLNRAGAIVLLTVTAGSLSVPATAAGREAPLPPAAQAAGCPAPNGQTTTHQNDIMVNETWAGDGTVHRVAFGITIRPGVTLTLASCAIVSVNPGLVLTVAGTPAAPAKLVSQGTAARPVLVTSAVAGQPWGMWRGLTAQSTFDLAYTTFENGGKGSFHGATISLRGGGPTEAAPVRVLKADHLVIRNSVGTGLVMDGGAAFTADSTALSVKGGGSSVQGGGYPIEIGPMAAGTLPTLDVSGNTHDVIRIAAPSLYISRDLTLKDLGAPYYFVFDRVRITDATGGTTPTLTIAPGVELQFDDYLQVGFFNKGLANQPGKLIAVGTAAKPIVFTSSKLTRAAGDWPGVYLLNAPGSRLEHVRIEYAGGPNGISSANCKPAGTTDAAALFIALGDAYVPSPGDFSGVVIANSKSHGINAMWTASAPGPDVTAGFTFEAINGCKQTRNRMVNGCVPTTGCLVPEAGGAAAAGTVSSTTGGGTTTAAVSVDAALTVPTPGSTLAGSAVTFSWTAGTGATNYWLDVGTGVGQGNIFASGSITGLSSAVTSLPGDGKTVYVQLWSYKGGVWGSPVKYTYTAGAVESRAVLVSPTPGSTLAGTTTTFSWKAAIGATSATRYWLDVGTAAGQGNISASGALTDLVFTSSGIPANGTTLHVQVWTFQDGVWLAPLRYTYLASPP